MSIAVIIPAFRCSEQILGVLNNIPENIQHIIVIDDCCPDQTGKFVTSNISDSRVHVIHNDRNLGVGGAVVQGYLAAVKLGAKYLVKVDGDGQMDPKLIDSFVEPLAAGIADYAKGNRFTSIEDVVLMPKIRVIGNLGLSFCNKMSSGYWQIMDPTNGYTAIKADLVSKIKWEKVSQRYYFETDILFRLGLMRAVVTDIPMRAIYGDETSHLKVKKIFFEFLVKHFRNFCKRIIYRYFMLDFNLGSVQLLGSLLLLPFSVVYGLYNWINFYTKNEAAPTGTIMVAALTFIVGFQLLIGWLSFDVQSEPRKIIT